MELSEKTVRCTDRSRPSPVPAACLFANSPALLTSSSAWLVEAAISSQFRRQPCHGGHDEKCAYSAGDHRNNWTKKIGDQTGFERAKFIRRSDKERIQRGHAAAHIVGSENLHES